MAMKKNEVHIDENILHRVIMNTADEKERNLFSVWYNASVENANFFEQLKKTWQLTSIDNDSQKRNWESIVGKVNSGKEVPEYITLPETKSSPRIFKLNTMLRVAAVLAVFFGVSILLRNIIFNSGQVVISANNSPSKPYSLPDGSKVYINGNSEISYSKNFGTKNREITLKGEAFFEVQKNENLPFFITTNNTSIKVLGTSFNVYSDRSKQVKVSVVTGVVEFSEHKGKKMVKLEAGEQGTYYPEKASLEKETISDPNFQAWKTGILYFNETPITEVFRLLQKQYLKTIVFEKNQGELPTLSTTFDNQSLKSVLEDLDLLLDVKHEIRNDTVFFKPNS